MKPHEGARGERKRTRLWPDVPADVKCSIGRTLSQLTHNCALQVRRVQYDIYGLAASLATSWAVLARSSLDEPQGNFVCDVLHNCAGALQQVRPHAHALRQAVLRRPPHNRLRSAQVVGLWCQADESEAWGEAATPRSAVLSQYYTSLSTVLVRLSNTSKLFDMFATDPAVSVRCAMDDDVPNRTCCYRVRVVERPCCSRPRNRRLTDLVLPAAAPADGRGAVREAAPGRQGAGGRIPGGLLQRPREQRAALRPGAGAGRELRRGGAAASMRCRVCVCWPGNASRRARRV